MNFFAGCQNRAADWMWTASCLPPSLNFCLRMLQRFSVGLRMEPRHKFVSFYAHSSQKCRGIICMMILVWKAQFFFLHHGRKWSVRNSTYFSEVIFTPSGTLKSLLSPHDSSPKHDSLGHGGHPSTTHYPIHVDHPGLHGTHQWTRLFENESPCISGPTVPISADVFIWQKPSSSCL